MYDSGSFFSRALIHDFGYCKEHKRVQSIQEEQPAKPQLADDRISVEKNMYRGPSGRLVSSSSASARKDQSFQ